MSMEEKVLSKLDDLLGRLEADWAASSNGKRLLKYVGIYSLVFIITFAIAYSPLLRAKVSLIWTGDGRYTYFPLLLYVGRYGKGIISQFLAGDFSIPLYDISLGVGDGVISFPASICYSSPLYVLGAILVPLRYSEFLYNFMSIFLVYLAGLTFSYMCRCFGKPARYTLIGSMVYCFSGYAMVVNTIDPYKFNAILTLPLLIAGTEKVLHKGWSHLFIFSVMWTALTNSFYFLYISTIVVVIFALVRFWRMHELHSYQCFFSLFVRGVAGYLLGLCLSGVVFFPTIAAFFEAGRSGHSVFTGLYPLQYYFTTLMHLISPPGGFSLMAFPAIALPALLFLFMASDKKTLKILVITAFMFFMLSPLGLLMNGFQYPSNRWIYALALVISYTVSEMFSELETCAKGQRAACLLLVAGYLIIAYIGGMGRTVPGYLEVGIAFLGLTVMCIFLDLSVRDEQGLVQKGKLVKYGKYLLLFALVIINIGFCGLFSLSKDKAPNILNHLSPIGTETVFKTSAPEREMISFLAKQPQGRVDSSTFQSNAAMLWNVPTLLPSDNPILNKYVCEHWLRMEGEEGNRYCQINSTDQRTIQNTLLSQLYHMEPKSKRAYVPYGYTLLGDTQRGYQVFKNEYALPWGYTYDKAVSYGYIEGMNGLQKQELMLQAIALEKTGPQSTEARINFDAERVPYKLRYENCSWLDGRLAVAKERAKVILLSDIPRDTELYVRVKGLETKDIGKFAFTANSNSVTKFAVALSQDNDYYYGRENYLFNLGYSDQKRHIVTLTFPFRGNFKLKDIELYALPMANYPARVNALRAEPLKNIQWGTNRLSGSVDLSKDKILCLSVPYSKGWSATVDGQEAEILRGNYMFMALPLKAGHHDIVFSYCPPGLKLGAVLTVLGWAAIIAMLVIDKRKAA